MVAKTKPRILSRISWGSWRSGLRGEVIGEDGGFSSRRAVRVDIFEGWSDDLEKMTKGGKKGGQGFECRNVRS